MKRSTAGPGPGCGAALARRGLLLAGLAIALGAAGCGHTRVEVESDVCWEGLINDNIRLSDCGNKKYDVSSGFKCAVFQKKSQPGYLRARVVDRTFWVETVEPYGIVRVCK